MAPPNDRSETKQPGRKSRKRVLIPVILGILLGTICVVAMRKVYNPFESGLGDTSLVALVPEDADLVLSVPHVPRFLGELRDREFVKRLEQADGFQNFLKSPYANRTGAVRAVSSAFAQLDRLRASRPLDLELWGELSGEELAVVGYAPQKTEDQWRVLVMFRPGSWKVLAAVNCLIDSDIGGLKTVTSELERQGITVQERLRDSITLKIDRFGLVSIARVRDAVLFGTDVRRLQRLKADIDRDGLPHRPKDRYAPLAAKTAASQKEIRAIVNRSIADAQLDLSRNLDEQWGPDNVALTQAILPRIAGTDLFVRLVVDDFTQLSIKTMEGIAKPADLSPAYQPFPKDVAVEALRRSAPLLPASTFAFGHFEVDTRRFLAALFQRPEVFSRADLSALNDALSSLREIKTVDGLVEAIDDTCHGSLSLAFFKQDREPLDNSEPGVATVFELKDEARLRTLIAAIQEQVRVGADPAKKGGLKGIVPSKSGEIDLFELVLPDGIVDDYRVTKPGFAISKGMIVCTNYFPTLREAAKAGNLFLADSPTREILERALATSPDDLRMAWAVAGTSMYSYFDQSVEGWATKRTTPSAVVERAWRTKAESDARARGLRPDTPEFTKSVEHAYEREAEAMTGPQRRAERAKLQQYLDYFRDLVETADVTVANSDGLDLTLRVDLKASK